MLIAPIRRAARLIAPWVLMMRRLAEQAPPEVKHPPPPPARPQHAPPAIAIGVAARVRR